MTGNAGYIIAAVILIIPQLIAIWQNRRIESKVDTAVDKVVVVEKAVNGALDKRVMIAEALGTAKGTAIGLEQGRTEAEHKK